MLQEPQISLVCQFKHCLSCNPSLVECFFKEVFGGHWGGHWLLQEGGSYSDQDDDQLRVQEFLLNWQARISDFTGRCSVASAGEVSCPTGRA